ncbi:hypothetical protein GCK32_005698 [Trichostrongylus colubriformis]|uniref:Uncharacterized protein n=1 Tax=Trichostrongylus colubriformis TaxID=6319 RepID=A0AAN8EZB2_TRICO
MSVFDKVKEKASESRWCVLPYKGFVVGSPTSTFDEIVTMAFDDVNNSYHNAKHSRFEEMYHPYLGSFRERKMYTTLAPSLCIPWRNRRCSYELAPHKAYSPKQGEWLVERPLNRFDAPQVPNLRRCYTLPTSTTRFENYFRYWHGRACGLDYIAPFLQPDDWRPAEDRRYHRIFWAPEFLPITPSCRHAANFMLTAY